MTQISLQARIKRILKQFTRDDEPELVNFVSGSNDTSSYGSIDDGQQYGDVAQDKRPDFVKRDLAGWK